METIQYTAKRNTLMIYLFVDSSGSMEIDSRMKTANKVIDTTVRKLRAVTDKTDKAELVFCSCAYGLVPKQIGMGPTPAEKFVWYEQTPGDGTCMGAALSVLDNALDYCKGSIYPPVILILSDGNSTDDILPALNQLQRNPLFEKSYKFGISFDSDREEDLAAVVGDGHLIHIQDIEGFYERIESAVQTMIENQKTVSAENPDTRSDGGTGDAEGQSERNTGAGDLADAGAVPFINHWSESDWL